MADLQAASNISFISVPVFFSFTQNLIAYRCSCKFTIFHRSFFHRRFLDTMSKFHDTNKNTPNNIKWYISVFVLARAISWCTLFVVTSVTTCGENISQSLINSLRTYLLSVQLLLRVHLKKHAN